MRAALSLGLCLTVLGLGFVTACLTARNRARGAVLDAKQRWSETFVRQNELLEHAVLQAEWRLLSDGDPELDPKARPGARPADPVGSASSRGVSQ